MPRYEGMDDLLRGVRERLEQSRGLREPARSPFGVEVPVSDEAYDSLIGNLGDLLRESERLRAQVTSPQGGGLSEEQRDRVLQLLGQVLEELWTAEAALQGVH